jgi:hypothetical protein
MQTGPRHVGGGLVDLEEMLIGADQGQTAALKPSSLVTATHV